MSYALGIWAARYFWIHLSLADLRSRWRRSFFGVLWTILQPLGLTLLLSFVFSRIFGTELGSYAPYILSGMIIWEYLTATVVGGSLAFVQADAYIKQTHHPLAIYTLRNVLSGLIVLALASTALVAWVLVVFPENLSWSWLAGLTIFPLLAMIAWPATTLIAYITTKYRDLQHALGLIMTSMWFVSPIYFEESVFRRGDLHILLDYNPIYHMLQLVRAPLLSGEWPTVANYLWCLGLAAVLSAIAIVVGKRLEKRVIFFL